MKEGAKHIRPLSYRQGRVVDLWIIGGCKSKAQAIRDAGYGESIARQPHKVFDSPRVLEELDKRGYNPNGSRFPVQAIEMGENTQPEPQLYDFTKMTNEQLQRLKERLNETPGDYLFPRKEEGISITSTTASIAIDQEQQDIARRNMSSL